MDLILDIVAFVCFPSALALLAFVIPGLLVNWYWEKESKAFKELIFFAKITILLTLVCIFLLLMMENGFWDGNLFC